jgi:putative transposase
VPSESTFKRWFSRWGWVRRRPRRVRRGTVVVRPRVRKAHASNEVWTVDFKGWFRTGDRRRIEPLTVRDLYSRKVLSVALLGDQKGATVQRAMRRIFARNGLPERIRCDNGYPFGSSGSMGLSRLSAWWMKLGIAVDFMDPGHPEQNGGHEQMHRILKQDTANPPAGNLEAQRKRSERWVREYNEVRPHEALGMKVPAEVYRASGKKLPRRSRPLEYPGGWERKWVKGNGEISREGRRWYVGEAYVGEYVGLKPSGRGTWKVYFGETWIGELREKESGSIRPRVYNRMRQQKRALRFRRASPARREPPKRVETEKCY